ncbi:MAG: LysR family transcriptional regulator [Desulfobaccales bacterium]|jgi:molybdate transport system regulatory protein
MKATSRSPKLLIKSKIWIEDEEGKAVFGTGRLRILRAVAERGSILAAAKALGMSYRAVWGKIKLTEDRLGQALLTTRAGGAHGGGSELTPFAKVLVARFQQLEDLTRTASDAFFSGVFANALMYKPAVPGESSD